MSERTHIEAWSISRLDVFETCPYRAYLQYVARVPQNPLVVPEGKDEHPLTRGIRVHDAAEEYVKQDILLIEELASFAEPLKDARQQYRDAPETCIVENDWAITTEWKPTGWFSDDAWGRMKLDLGLIDHGNRHIRVVDYKTGRRYPLKHIQQGQLYGLAAALRYPDIDTFSVEFWYTDLDTNNTLVTEYSRIKLLIFQEDFNRRAQAMTQATEFLPRASAYACRFCPYGEGRDGNSHCEFRFSNDNS
jgi:RecB family exonuclease